MAFIGCSLAGQENTPSETHEAALAGTSITSLQRGTDKGDNDGTVFVFDNLLVKLEDKFRLQFDLFKMGDDQYSHIQSVSYF